MIHGGGGRGWGLFVNVASTVCDFVLGGIIDCCFRENRLEEHVSARRVFAATMVLTSTSLGKKNEDKLFEFKIVLRTKQVHSKHHAFRRSF